MGVPHGGQIPTSGFTHGLTHRLDRQFAVLTGWAAHGAAADGAGRRTLGSRGDQGILDVGALRWGDDARRAARPSAKRVAVVGSWRARGAEWGGRAFGSVGGDTRG